MSVIWLHTGRGRGAVSFGLFLISFACVVAEGRGCVHMALVEMLFHYIYLPWLVIEDSSREGIVRGRIQSALARAQ